MLFKDRCGTCQVDCCGVAGHKSSFIQTQAIRRGSVPRQLTGNGNECGLRLSSQNSPRSIHPSSAFPLRASTPTPPPNRGKVGYRFYVFETRKPCRHEIGSGIRHRTMRTHPRAIRVVRESYLPLLLTSFRVWFACLDVKKSVLDVYLPNPHRHPTPHPIPHPLPPPHPPSQQSTNITHHREQLPVPRKLFRKRFNGTSHLQTFLSKKAGLSPRGIMAQNKN